MSETLQNSQANPELSQTHNENASKIPSLSLYEQSREERIKENLQRMQKLGLPDLSLKLKSFGPKRAPRRSPSNSPRPTSALPSGPHRRSSRLQNVTPVSYSEEVLSMKVKRKNRSLKNTDVKLNEGSRPEVYTEEHEKLLGSTERSWTLFVDGYGKDGRRIYDPVLGKTCHQCRQKTLGYHTHCSKCNQLRGQFCGDCLYMRYGEHIFEAIENPDWTCPVCRGICNCSFCRQAKGWQPTGPLYRKILSLGFKSVAHYLIQTRRAPTNLQKDPDTIDQASARRTLSFSDKELVLNESLTVDENQLGTSKPQSEDKKHNEDVNIEKENKMQGTANPSSDYQSCPKRSLPFSDIEIQSVSANSGEVKCKVQNHHGLAELQLEDKRDNGVKGEQEKQYTDGEHNYSNIALGSCCLEPKKKRPASEPSPDSIGGRVRQRRRRSVGCDAMELPMVDEKILDVKQTGSHILSEKELEKGKEIHINDVKHVVSTLDGSPKLESKPTVSFELCSDSITQWQKHQETKDHENERLSAADAKTSDILQAVNDILMEKKAKIGMKHTTSADTSQDSIARKLRPRIKAA